METKIYQISPTVSWSSQRLQARHPLPQSDFHPTHQSPEKEIVWAGNKEGYDAFGQSHSSMAQRPVLNIHDPSKECILYCDDSHAGIEEVLNQVGGETK